MKIQCDKELSVGWRIFQKEPPTLSATFIVKAVCQLKPGQLEFVTEHESTVTGDSYTDGDLSSSLRYDSDFAIFKPRADVMLVGSAYAPDGRATDRLSARLRVGAMSKTLEVFGNRTWKSQLRGLMSDPVPFERMPLEYCRAAGGSDCASNPIGKGKEEPPNLEYPHLLMRHPDDRLVPACLGPVSPGWQPRACKTGTYDERWRKERWPWFPEDFDWSYFNAAPHDQQVDGYLRGDETLELDHLHPEQSSLSARLPGRRARWFVRKRTSDGELVFKEVPLKLDTVWIDTDAERLVLVWRGLCNVKSIRLHDIEEVLVLSEPLAQPLRSLSEYQTELDRRMKQQGEDPELAQALRDADEETESAERELEELRESQCQKPAAGSNDAADHQPTIADVCQSLRAEAENLRAAGVGEQDPALISTEEQLAQLEALAEEFGEVPPLDRRAVEQAARSGASLAKCDLSKLDLSGLDLRGADLSGAILNETNLKNAILTDVNFTEALLLNTDLTHADLTRATLDGAILIDSRVEQATFAYSSVTGTVLSKLALSEVDFRGCEGEGADFSAAQLAGADFGQARLPAADFSQCNLEGANFSKAQLRRARFDRARAARVSMKSADLCAVQACEQADFSGADLRCCNAEDSVWQTAVLNNADFSSSELARAVFAEASLRRTRFHRADLSGVDFSDACLRRAILTESNLLRATFDRADLGKSDFAQSNLYEAGFWDSMTEEAEFRDAILKCTLLDSRT